MSTHIQIEWRDAGQIGYDKLYDVVAIDPETGEEKILVQAGYGYEGTISKAHMEARLAWGDDIVLIGL